MCKQKKYCIFCFRNNTEISFNREHIIPQNIGGNLYIDEVCQECNSILGRYVDIQVLKYPEILKAFSELDIPHNKSGILKNHFNVKGKSDNMEVSAIYKDGKYEMLPKEMPDGSIIVPEEKYKSTLIKMVIRDDRIKSKIFPQNYIDKEIKNISLKYDDVKPGELVHAPSVGRSVLKRRDNFKIVIEPKGKCEIERLIAKIYYEVLYLVGGSFVFSNVSLLQPVFDLIDKGKLGNGYYFSRQESKFDHAINTHLIRFVFKRTHQQLYVSFFGILDFMFMTFFHYSNFWDKIQDHQKCSNICGIHFEQDVKTGDKNFWFIDNNENIF